MYVQFTKLRIRLCPGCSCLLLHLKAFRSQDALQPTHKHFYKYCQNSHRDCSNDEFSIVEEVDSVYNIVAIATCGDELGQSRGGANLYLRGTDSCRPNLADKPGLYPSSDLPSRH